MIWMVYGGTFARLTSVGAERILAGGSSAFHKTGFAAVSFMRAIIGFEAEAMKEGIWTDR
jgi:hypothetical protein